MTSRARRAFVEALRVHGNPSSPHEEGRTARALLEDARTRIARLAGSKPDAVILTAGATEANALALVGHIEALHENGREYASMHVLYLPSAHASVQGAMEMLGAKGVRTEEMGVAGGSIDLAKLKEQLTTETVLVSVDVVCGETGTLYKVRDVRRTLDAYAKEENASIVLYADASQAPFVESFELPHLGADMVTLDAQKVGGVRGIGCLVAPRRVPLVPLIRGGGQERGLRPGTESSALAVAFATALEAAHEGRTAFTLRARAMRSGGVRTMLASVPNAIVNEGKEQAPHILNLSVIGRDTDYLVALLDEAGFAVATKSACETDTKGSRAVAAMTGDPSRAESTLRVSWGPETRERDLEGFAKAVAGAVRFLDAHAIYSKA